jgi:hypothetical protein
MSLPVATSQETIQALLRRAKRKTAVPIRRSFLQGGELRSPRPGPLADFVRNRDDRGLELYLLAVAVASAEPWNIDEPANLWARVLDLDSTDGTASAGATSAVSKIWKRLEDRRLIARARVKRRASVTLLREDGSGRPYEHPGKAIEAYLQLPLVYWTAPEAWYRTLDLAEKAVLLIALSRTDDFILPCEKAKTWYGISADTAERGLRGLGGRRLLTVREGYKTAALAPKGYTKDFHYTLGPPFGPRGVRSSHVAKRIDEGHAVASPS